MKRSIDRIRRVRGSLACKLALWLFVRGWRARKPIYNLTTKAYLQAKDSQTELTELQMLSKASFAFQKVGKSDLSLGLAVAVHTRAMICFAILLPLKAFCG